MSKNDVLCILKELDIDVHTISFYCNIEGDLPDCEFGCCDISGIQGNVVNCIACSASHPEHIIEFQALESLVGTHLGSIAGAF